MSTLVSTNPAKGYAILGEVAVSTPAQIEAAVHAAHQAFPAWKALGLQGRIEALKKFLAVLEKRKDDMSLLASREMGVALTGSEATSQRVIDNWKWNLENAPRCLAPEETYRDEHEIAEVRYEPTGVATVIVPWNFPFSNFTWNVSQNLIAGNTVVFKISEEVPLCGKLIDQMFAEAGVPEGVFNQVYGAGEVGAHLLKQKVDLMCFTGSSATGRHVYRAASEQMIPALLEMGGSDPGIVFADADLDATIAKIYSARFRNCGQVCNALKRLIVHKSRFGEVVERLKAMLATKIVGDPEDRATEFGPLAAKRQLDLLEQQVEDARQRGADILLGGDRPQHLDGAFYNPTLVASITPDMRLWREEVFGPVLPIVTFDTYEEAIHLAKDTPYGLGSYIFTSNADLANRASADVRAGMVQVNQSIGVRSCNPFGGCGISGLGMENGRYGFHDVSRRKLVTRML